MKIYNNKLFIAIGSILMASSSLAQLPRDVDEESRRMGKEFAHALSHARPSTQVQNLIPIPEDYDPEILTHGSSQEDHFSNTTSATP